MTVIIIGIIAIEIFEIILIANQIIMNNELTEENQYLNEQLRELRKEIKRGRRCH